MQNINYAFLLSRPVWGAWIEISRFNIFGVISSRAPYGARGLKYPEPQKPQKPGQRRAPYGARGLKFCRICIEDEPR